MKHYTAYIDEAGDEGFGKLANPDPGCGQSHWLILGSIIIPDENRRLTASWRNDVLSNFPRKQTRDLHWRHLKHEQKIVVCNLLAEMPMGIGLTLSHKVTLPGSRYAGPFKQKGYLYNYLVRWLLERLICACKVKAAPDEASLRVVFSRRGGTNYQSMAQYLQKLANGEDLIKSPRITDWSVLNIPNIAVENHSKSPGLQLADCVTSAFYQGVEPNSYGNTEPAYGLKLAPRLIGHKTDPLNKGITVVPSVDAARCSNEQAAFINNCRRKGRQAPGS